MTTVINNTSIILKSQNPVTANDHYTMTAGIRTQISSYKAQNPLTANYHQSRNLPINIAYYIDRW
jgi:hypothetical protein